MFILEMLLDGMVGLAKILGNKGLERLLVLIIICGVALFVGGTLKTVVADAWDTHYVEPMSELNLILDGDFGGDSNGLFD